MKLSKIFLFLFAVLLLQVAKGQSKTITNTIDVKDSIRFRSNWINSIDTDTSLQANSDQSIATQKATKAYVDNHRGQGQTNVIGGSMSVVGTIYDSSKWTTLSPYIMTGGLNVNIVGGNLVFSGGNVTTNQTLQINRPTVLHYWTSDLWFSVPLINDTTFGPGNGVKSINAGPFDGIFTFMSNSSSSGRLYYWSHGLVYDSSDTRLQYAPLDTILFTVERVDDSLRATARNVSKPGTPIVSKSVTGNYSSESGVVMPNTGNFALVNVHGPWTAYRWRVSSTETRNGPIVFLVDSKAEYSVSNKYQRYPFKLGNNYPGVVISGGPGDRLVEVMEHMQESLSLSDSALYVLWAGRNDTYDGGDTATVKVRVNAVVDTLTAHHKNWIICPPAWEPLYDNSWLANYILTTFKGRTIDTWHPTLITGRQGMAQDSAHFNDFEHEQIYELLLKELPRYINKGAGFHLEQSTFPQMLAINNRAATNMIIGKGPVQCSVCSGVYTQNANGIDIASGSDAVNGYFAFHSTKNSTYQIPGGTILFKSDRNGNKIPRNQYGDSTWAAIQGSQPSDSGQYITFKLPLDSVNEADVCEVRSPQNPIEGPRTNYAFEAGYQLNAGVHLNSPGATNMFQNSLSTFNLDCHNQPLTFYNIPIVPLDTAHQFLMVMDNAYHTQAALHWPASLKDTFGTSQVNGYHILGQLYGTPGDPALISYSQELPFKMTGTIPTFWLTARGAYLNSSIGMNPLGIQLHGDYANNGFGAQFSIYGHNGIMGNYLALNDSVVGLVSAGGSSLNMFSNSANIAIGSSTDDKVHLLQVNGIASLKGLQIYAMPYSVQDTVNKKIVVMDLSGNFYWTNWPTFTPPTPPHSVTYITNTGTTNLLSNNYNAIAAVTHGGTIGSQTFNVADGTYDGEVLEIKFECDITTVTLGTGNISLPASASANSYYKYVWDVPSAAWH